MARYDNILTATAFERVNRVLVSKLGINCAIMASELLSLQKYFKNKNQLNEYGFYFNTYDYFMQDTGLTRKQISNAITKLAKANIVDTHVTYEKGTRTKWYKINTKVYDEYLKSGDGSICMNTETKDSYIIYNKRLAVEIGPTAAIIFSDLITTYYNYEIKNNLVNGVWFKSSQKTLADRCGITPQAVCTKYIPQLKKNNLIDLQFLNFPRVSHISINFDTLESILGTSFDYTTEKINDDTNTLKLKLSDDTSKEELITKKILMMVEDLSGQTWEFDYAKVQNIADRLNEGTTEDQLLSIIDHMYNYYKDGKYYDKYFTWENLIGTKSKVKDWLKKIDNDTKKADEKSKIESIAQNISNALCEYTNGEVDHKIKYEYVNTIKHRLSEGLTEDDLIKHACSRYDFLKKGSYNINRGCSWNKLFGPKCYDEIHAVKTAGEGKKSNNKNNKSDKSRDNVESRSLTQDEINRAIEMAKLAEANGEQGFF